MKLSIESFDLVNSSKLSNLFEKEGTSGYEGRNNIMVRKTANKGGIFPYICKRALPICINYYRFLPRSKGI